jgi:hypothetical protein
VTTQLRLVEPPEPRSRPAKAASKASSKATSKAPSKGTVGRARPATRATARGGRTTARGGRTTARGGRRAASWGEWRLDAGTRQVGRAGVAQARRALEAVLETSAEDRLSQAS